MPRSATSSKPFLLLSAPVNAPRMCPNSSDSSSVSGQRAAVERHHRLARGAASGNAPPAPPALAGARFAGQQDRAVGARDGLDHLEDVEHGLAAADDVRELVREAERALQQHVLLPQLAALDLLAHFHLQQIDVERLAQIVAGAEPHRFDRGFASTRTP